MKGNNSRQKGVIVTASPPQGARVAVYGGGQTINQASNFKIGAGFEGQIDGLASRTKGPNINQFVHNAPFFKKNVKKYKPQGKHVRSVEKTNNGRLFLGFHTTCPLEPGTEIFASYGGGYWPKGSEKLKKTDLMKNKDKLLWRECHSIPPEFE